MGVEYLARGNSDIVMAEGTFYVMALKDEDYQIRITETLTNNITASGNVYTNVNWIMEE